MSTILFLSCVTSFIMLIWFKTDAVIEWADLFKLHWITRDFKSMRIAVAPELLTYPQYLRKRHDCFMTRLCSCPFCACVWLVAFQCFGLAILLKNLHMVALFPIVYFVSLFIYGAIVKLYNMMP